MPCAGSFLYRPSQALTEAALRQWWDFDLPLKNFKHFHEQDALWHMIEAEVEAEGQGGAVPGGRKEGQQQQQQQHKAAASTTGASGANSSSSYVRPYFLINSQTYSVLKERQFPSAWTRYEDLWLTHIASYNYLLRTPILFQYLKVLALDVPHRFAAQVAEINQHHTLRVTLLEVTMRMERISQQVEAIYQQNLKKGSADVASAERGRGGRVTEFPKHDPATELAWYDAHVSSKQETPLPLHVLHEGRLIRRKGTTMLLAFAN
jgi:hypothetical protein